MHIHICMYVCMYVCQCMYVYIYIYVDLYFIRMFFKLLVRGKGFQTCCRFGLKAQTEGLLVLCNKCKQAKPYKNDTWCLACTAWEQLEAELGSSWYNPALRHAATEVVVSAVKQARAMRNISSSLRSAGDSRGAGGSGSAPARRSGTVPKALPPPPPPPPP